MSKVQSGKCSFIVTRGVNKGKICGKPTKNKFCKCHNPRRLEYVKTKNAQYNEKNRIKNINKELEKLGEKQIKELPSLDKVRIDSYNITNDMIYVLKQIIGIAIFLEDKETEEKCRKIITPVCICKKDKYDEEIVERDPKCRKCIMDEKNKRFEYVPYEMENNSKNKIEAEDLMKKKLRKYRKLHKNRTIKRKIIDILTEVENKI